MEEQVRSSSLRYVCLEGHANSFAMNKDYNCIAVAGRSCEFCICIFKFLIKFINIIFLNAQSQISSAKSLLD